MELQKKFLSIQKRHSTKTTINYNTHILEKKYYEKRNTFHEKPTNNNLHVKLCIEYNDEMKLLRSKSRFGLQKICLTWTLNNFYRFN